MDQTATFFTTPQLFRKWLQLHHQTEKLLWVGFYKTHTSKASLTWPESVDVALCFGWIDGLRKRIDDESYQIRFSPRKVGSIWSNVNIGRVEFLIEAGAMTPSGMQAFEARQENKSGIYSYEQRSEELPKEFAKPFKANRIAWKYYQSQPISYRKAANWWVVSAKRPETQLRRLTMLIETSSKGEWIKQFLRPKSG